MSGLQTSHKDIIGDMLNVSTQTFVDESSMLTAVNGTPSTGQFRSSITGRAPIPDITNDLKASLGIDRFVTHKCMRMHNEVGPNGELVWGIANDTRNLIRFFGPWNEINNPAWGQCIQSDSSKAAYVEIVFYGKVLNLLTVCNNTGSFYVSLDGGSESTVTVGNGGTILYNVSKNQNTRVKIATASSLGLHTVKIRVSDQVSISGFEVSNNNTDGMINVNSGTAYSFGKKIINSTAKSIHFTEGYNSALNSGKGARVVQYISENDTISSTVTLVNNSEAYGNSADHSNEEMYRRYFVREFGVGRRDLYDLSAYYDGNDTNYAFTLEDGLTTLYAGHSWLAYNPSGNIGEYLETRAGGSPAYIMFTFEGTGLDIEIRDTGTGAESGDQTWTIDNGSPQSWFYSSGDMTRRIQKVASGLPYGTHTFKITANNPHNFRATFYSFKVYKPKKPTIPSNAVEIADYNIVATYSQNTSYGSGKISTGVSRCQNVREFLYSTGWGGGNVNWNDASLSGIDITSGTNGAYFEFWFWGTGFEIRGYNQTNRSSNVTVQVDGVTPTGTTSAYGGWAYSSGTLDCANGLNNGVGAGLVSYGYTLDWHKVKLINNTTGFLTPSCIDIITPIRSNKENSMLVVNNTTPIGSNSLKDSRNIYILGSDRPSQKMRVACVSLPNGDQSHAPGGGNFVPINGMGAVVKTKGMVRVSYTVVFNQGSGVSAFTSIFVDGIEFGRRSTGYSSSTDWEGTYHEEMVIPLSEGHHYIDVRVSTGGTVYSYREEYKKTYLLIEEL